MRPQRDIEAELDAFLGRKKHHWLRWVLLAFGLLFGLILSVTVGAGFMIYQRLVADLPQVSDLEHYQPSLVTKVYDRYGELIADFFIEKRILVPLEDIPLRAPGYDRGGRPALLLAPRGRHVGDLALCGSIFRRVGPGRGRAPLPSRCPHALSQP